MRIDGHPQGMFAIRLHLVIDIGPEAQDLLAPGAFDHQLDRHEGCIVDTDSAFLYRGHKEIVIPVAPDDGGKQPHHRLPSDRRAQVMPAAIAGDTHIDIAAAFRVPQVHRGQPLALVARDLSQQISRLACIAHVRPPRSSMIRIACCRPLTDRVATLRAIRPVAAGQLPGAPGPVCAACQPPAAP